ncbi:MAG: AAA family ATPase [Planctomycetota bacterium]
MQSIHIVLISSDPSLAREFENAGADLRDEVRLVLHAESDTRRGIERAVDGGAGMVVLALDDDVPDVERSCREIASAGGGPLIVVAYRPEVLGGDQAASSVLIDLMRAGAGDFLRRPTSSSELEELMNRHLLESREEASQTERGRILAFVGNKGGVGKSTVSLSVACRLAQRAPGRVLLVDASLQHGAMSELLDLRPEATICDAARQVDRLDGRLLRMLSVQHDSGLRVLAAPPNAVDAAPVDDRTLARILSVARRAFDFVVVDTFPQIDGITVTVLDVADRVFVVTNDFVPAILGTADLLSVLDRLGVPGDRVRVVLNHCHSSFRGRLRPVDVATRIGHDIEFSLPFSKQVLTSTNSGEPYILRAPGWRGFGKAVRAIERDILLASNWKAREVRNEVDELDQSLSESEVQGLGAES